MLSLIKLILIISLLFSTATAQNRFFFAQNKPVTVVVGGGGNTGAFSFTLAAPASTSAGVYKNDSILIRTLWSNERYAAGTYNKKWNGTDDYGNIITSPDATYKIKVLSNNVNYDWLGGSIGNTSDSTTGVTRNKGGYHCMRGLAFVGNYGYYCTGYSEGSPSLAKFNIAAPNTRILMVPANQNTGDINYVTTDGTKVYWGMYDSYSYTNSWVFGTNVSDDLDVNFSSGVPYSLVYGYKTYNCISKLAQVGSHISGLTVQKTGNYLFVARVDLNQLQVLNKTTGALVQTLTYTLPKGLSIDGSDNLWMITNNTNVSKYTVNTDGTLTTATLTLSGLVAPLSTQVNTSGTQISITDGGNSQQVKFFSNLTGALINTIGTANGYSSDANVANSKFYFSNIDNSTEGENGMLPFISFQSDDSYWVNEEGNFRVQHFNSSNTYLNRIMALGSTYHVFTDFNNPSRMMSEFLEFEINYTIPTTASNWTLKRNYGATVSRLVYDGPPSGITTLSNGRAYGLMRKKNPTSDFELVEFSTTGTMRLSGQILSGFGNILCRDGAIQVFTELGDFTPSSLTRYPLTGFDASNNPIWSSTGEFLMSAIKSDTAIGNTYFYPSESYHSTNKLVSFNTSSLRSTDGSVISHRGYHLGISYKGAVNTFLAKTEKSNHRAYIGDYPDAGWFEEGNDVNAYAGGKVNIVDRNIITSYHGEFWKGSQTNKFNHYWDNGLAIGQFGTTGRDNWIDSGKMAGNVLTPALIKIGNGDSLFMNLGDESATGGNHMWKITNLNSINEQVVTIPFPSAYTPEVVNYTDLLAGLPFNSKIIGSSAGWTISPTLDSTTWTTRTSAITYDYLKSPDIYARFDYQTATNNTVSRNLGVNNVTSNWTLTGEIFNGYAAGYNASPAFAYIKVLDDAGKELAKFYAEKLSAGAYPLYTSSIKFNTVTLFTRTTSFTKAVDSIIFKSQPFNLTINNGSVTFQYAGLSTVITTISDPTANWHTPTTLQIEFINNGSAGLAYSREIALRYLKFYKDSF